LAATPLPAGGHSHVAPAGVVAETERARQRLALDEVFELQHRLQLRRKHFQTKARTSVRRRQRLIKPFLRKRASN
jgi:RecG-like helicase